MHRSFLTRFALGIIFLPLVVTPTPVFNWTQVNAPGFDEHLPPYTGQEAFESVVYQDRIYLGMEGRACARIWRARTSSAPPASQADWQQVVSDGFDGSTDCDVLPPTTDNDHIDSLEPFAGYLYASTAMQTGQKRGSQVWRSASGDPGAWKRVSQPGFGLHTNENIKDMIGFGGLLCGGTINLGDNGIPPGAQVWCTDGVTGDPDHPDELVWSQRNRSGFGRAENVKIWSSAEYGAALYYGVEAQGGDGSIWRTRNIEDPDAWELVFTPADFGLHAGRVDVLQGFAGHIYAGFRVEGEGSYVYRSATGDRQTWEGVVTRGFGSRTSGQFIPDASAELDGALYLAVLDETLGVSVWRTADGLVWARVSPYGFGDAANFSAQLTVFRGDLYAWTSNHAVGQGVWRGQAGP